MKRSDSQPTKYSMSQPVLYSTSILVDGKKSAPLSTEIDEKQYDEALPIIKKTWRELMRNKTEVGHSIYHHVLTKDISMSRLFINTKIDKQAASFMTMLDTVVGYLDDRTTMDKKLEELGRIHNLRYGVKPRHYKHFRTAFMKAISMYVPWNNRRENAWLWFWDHIIAVMSIHAENETTILPFNLSPAKSIEYVSAIHDSLDNVIDQAPFEFVKRFYELLQHEQPALARTISPIMGQPENARFIAMLQHTIRLLDDQSAFQKKIILLVSRYHAYCNLSTFQFAALIQTFIRALKRANYPQWKPIHEEAWQWLSQLVIRLFTIAVNTRH